MTETNHDDIPALTAAVRHARDEYVRLIQYAATAGVAPFDPGAEFEDGCLEVLMWAGARFGHARLALGLAQKKAGLPVTNQYRRAER